MSKPLNLLENQTVTVDLPPDFSLADLNQYLDEVWQSRFFFDESITSESVNQPFLTFGQNLRTGETTIRAGKYVGFIQFNGFTIQILPKLFAVDQADKALKHLIWWLSYCRKIKFPFNNLLGNDEAIDEFPETLISYFAQFTNQLVSSHPYSQYEEFTDTVPYLRGKLNVQQYVTDSISKGNWHQLVCDHEPFQFNNRLNQIIKHVARKLTNLCRFSTTHHQLEQLLFILDEVDDLPATVQDCDTLTLNRYYNDYEDCLAMCRFFLSDNYLNQPDTDRKHFCFLVPMDYVFEDFIAGFIEFHMSTLFFRLTNQATEWLTVEEVFQIRNDLLLTYPDKSKLVVDTKYKLRGDKTSKKAGINQVDLYQMVSYALRQNTKQVLLLYPVAYGEQTAPVQKFTVTSELMDNQLIHIRTVDLSITGGTKEDIIFTLLIQLTQALNQPATS